MRLYLIRISGYGLQWEGRLMFDKSKPQSSKYVSHVSNMIFQGQAKFMCSLEHDARPRRGWEIEDLKMRARFKDSDNVLKTRLQ